MKLTILGTGSPLPVPGRVQTGCLLEKDNRLLLVDCGSGVYDQLKRLQVDWKRLDTFLLTHHHLDHLSDLFTIVTARFLLGYPKAAVYGPSGTKALIEGLLDLFPYVRHFADVQAYDIQAGEDVTITGFDISNMAMRHFNVTTLSYKFDGILVICGDSDPLPELKAFAQGCKLLIHECSYTDKQAGNGHAHPTGLGEVLAGAKLDELWLTHFYPEASQPQQEDAIIQAVQRYFKGKVRLAQDMMEIRL